ncbi:hypothetical protein OAU50_06055 [Planctomycetota bacterium]|nr:hypothetical protein [Planctomycetota bacterium]
MNKEQLNKFVVNNVNLNGYANSEGFLGYIERHGKHSFKKAVSTVSRMLEEPILSDVSWVHNLFICFDFNPLNENFQKQDYAQGADLLNKLISSNSVHCPPENENCWGRLDTFLSKDMQVVQNTQCITNLMIAVMTVGGLAGHCFGVSPSRELIVYPHEDIGFGFISTASSQEEARSFQSYLDGRFRDTHAVTMWKDGQRPA